MSYEITEIWRYPIKSMGGQRIESTALTSGGIPGDRRWALRSTDTGMIVSAKKPRPFGSLLEWSAALATTGRPVVTAPDGRKFEAGGSELDAALTEAFGEAITVDPVSPGQEEAYDSAWPEIPGTTLSDTEMVLPMAMATEKSSFVDLAALHLIVESSMQHLATLVDGVTVGVERFRPSIVLRDTDGGSDGFADLDWADVTARVGTATINVSHAAPRCVMTTLPQGDYEQAEAVLATLATHARRDLAIGPFACFGTYAEITADGVIAVGDRFELD